MDQIRLFFRVIKNRHQGAGFTMVGVLVILGAVAILSLAVSKALINSRRAQLSFTASQRYRDVEQQIIDLISLNVDKQLKASGTINFNTLFTPPGDMVQYQTNFPLFATTNNTPLTQSKQRCAQPIKPQNPNTGSFFLFCVQPLQDNTAPKGSFLAASASMVEVQISLIDLQTLAPITMQTYQSNRNSTGVNADKSAGASLAIKIFWENKTKTDPDPHLNTHDILSIINFN